MKYTLQILHWEPSWQKEEVIALLWTLAVSDNNLDKHEDYLVRKIADLLYVSNSIVLKIKHQVFTK